MSRFIERLRAVLTDSHGNMLRVEIVAVVANMAFFREERVDTDAVLGSRYDQIKIIRES